MSFCGQTLGANADNLCIIEGNLFKMRFGLPVLPHSLDTQPEASLYRTDFGLQTAARLSRPALSERSIVMKSYRLTMISFVVLASLFVASIIDSAVAQDTRLLKEFTRTGYFSGTKLSFVLLNDKTIDIFFKGSSKDTVQAKVDAGTCFYVAGTADKNMKMSTDFVVEQDGEKITGTVLNLGNFVDGSVAKGEKFSGVFQLQKKLKLNHLFAIRGAGGLVEFKLSSLALMNVSNE